MSLAVAIQMDPLETVDIDGDSSFALALEAQSRGHGLYHYLPRQLSYRQGRIVATARPFQVRREPGRHVGFGAPEIIDLATMDVILMRQDPPFNLAYISATHLLDRIHPQTLVVNDPHHVRNAPEKLFVTQFAELMPPTLITNDLDEIKAFRREFKDIIVKPLYGNGGAGVFHLKPGDTNLGSLVELFKTFLDEPLMAQRYIPEIRQGDKRIILIDGKPAGCGQPRAGGRGDPRQPACRRPGREGPAHQARPRDLRDDRPDPARARPDLRRHRRDRRLADRDQRHLAHRPAGDRPLRRRQPGRPDLGRDRGPHQPPDRARAADLSGGAGRRARASAARRPGH